MSSSMNLLVTSANLSEALRRVVYRAKGREIIA